MEIIKSICGISDTKPPSDNGSWYYSKGRIIIEWAKVQELQKPCSAIRLEGQGLKEKIFLIYGLDGQYYAFKNKYPPFGKRLDPVQDMAKIRCCGLLETTFDYSGNVMSGFGKEPLKKYKVELRKCRIIIWVESG